MECLDRRHLGHFGLRHGGRGQRRRRRHPSAGRGALDNGSGSGWQSWEKWAENGWKMDGTSGKNWEKSGKTWEKLGKIEKHWEELGKNWDKLWKNDGTDDGKDEKRWMEHWEKMGQFW